MRVGEGEIFSEGFHPSPQATPLFRMRAELFFSYLGVGVNALRDKPLMMLGGLGGNRQQGEGAGVRLNCRNS